MPALDKQFEEYLKLELRVSVKTLRNYRADLGHFLRWSKARNLESLVPDFSLDLVASYKAHQTRAGVPKSSTNRRLSTLRNFGRFLAHLGIIVHNPATLVANLKVEPTQGERMQAVISEFAKQLEKDGASRTTQKNYLSDVRHFLAWLNRAQVAP